MNCTGPISAKTHWSSRMKSGSGIQEVTLIRNNLTVIRNNNQARTIIPTMSILGAQISEGDRHNCLTIKTSSGNTIEADELCKEASKRLCSALEVIAKENRKRANENRKREDAEKARDLAPQIDDLHSCLTNALSPDRYARHSSVSTIPKAAAALVKKCNRRTEKHLKPDHQEALAQLRRAADPKALENDRAESNGGFIQRTGPAIQDSTRDIFPDGLTQEQVQAIATDEDCTLVLAGAGTGKTSVIIGKIAHLVRNQGVLPESILALAFNNERSRGD